MIGLPVESGAPPAGYRVFRVRSSTLSLDGSTMGPAKIDETNAGWQAYAGTTLAGNPLTGMFVVDTAATPSWYPYYYRIKAIGVQDLANGLFAGESDFSGVQSASSYPPGPPLISSFTLATNVNAALVTLMTDLPAARKSPAGAALVEVVQLIPDPAHPGRTTSKVILTKAPEQIAVGTLNLPLTPPPPPATDPAVAAAGTGSGVGAVRSRQQRSLEAVCAAALQGRGEGQLHGAPDRSAGTRLEQFVLR